MRTLETQRLILRNVKKSDVHDFYEFAKSPNIGPNAGWEPHNSLEMSLGILRSIIESNNVWAIVYKENNKMIGSIGLHKDIHRNPEDIRMLGYVLSEKYWGKGITTEAAKEVIRYAFEDLNLSLISIQHYPHNIRSMRVIEKCGFKYEGTLRYAAKIFNGSVYDLMCYSLTKDEWESYRKI